MIRIIIADDHAIVRKGLIQLIQENVPQASIDEVNSAEMLINKVLKNDYHLIISDLSMPGRTGLDALNEIKAQKPHMPFLLLSIHPEEQYAIRALKAGASGYLTKDAAPNELALAINQVLAGKRYISQKIAEKLVTLLDHEVSSKPLHETLSNREFEVFKHLAKGKSVSEIAEQYFLSANTISTYKARILEKMNFKSNADITRYALENNLI